jgi:hypothetical protein
MWIFDFGIVVGADPSATPEPHSEVVAGAPGHEEPFGQLRGLRVP